MLMKSYVGRHILLFDVVNEKPFYLFIYLSKYTDDTSLVHSLSCNLSRDTFPSSGRYFLAASPSPQHSNIVGQYSSFYFSQVSHNAVNLVYIIESGNNCTPATIHEKLDRLKAK